MLYLQIVKSYVFKFKTQNKQHMNSLIKKVKTDVYKISITYKRKFIALFLLILIKFNKKYKYYAGFCSLINHSFKFKLNSKKLLFLQNKIEYIKPNDLNIKDPLMKKIGFWFDPHDWEIRIKYLKTILKE